MTELILGSASLVLYGVALLMVHFRLLRLEKEAARTAAIDDWLRPKFTSESDTAGDHLWGDTP